MSHHFFTARKKQQTVTIGILLVLTTSKESTAKWVPAWIKLVPLAQNATEILKYMHHSGKVRRNVTMPGWGWSSGGEIVGNGLKHLLIIHRRKCK